MQGRTVADGVVAGWEQAGVGAAFGLDDPQAIFKALRGSSIRTVIVHDERSGAFMADGYSRASLRPSVCGGIHGPGATNLATGMVEAHAASSPVIAMVSERDGTLQRPAFQDVPHEDVLSPLAKAVVRVEDDEPGVVGAYSASLSLSGRPRPVLVLASDDGLWDSAPAEDSVSVAEVTPVAASPETIASAVELLAAAERPLIVAGNGVHIAGAYEELAAVAEAFGAPVVTTLLGKGAIAETHPYSLGVASAYNGGANGHGKAATECCVEADVLLIVGTDLDPITTSYGSWPAPSTRVIRVDVDLLSGLAQGGVFAVGDAREVLRGLLRQAPVEAPKREWVREKLELAASERSRLEALDLAEAPDDTVSPALLIRAIGSRLDPGDALVTDASYSSAWAIDRVHQRAAGRQVFAPRGAGTLGWGLPAALGVRIARPTAKVACVTGDGGLLFSLAELETAVRERLPVVLFLLNNSSYGFQRHADMKKQGVDHDDLQIGALDWSAFARGSGWHYLELMPDSDMTAVIDEAFAHEGPVFVELPVDADSKPPLTMFDELEAVTH